ncbi:MAG TPA: xanthine phosphoribosyltransferase [Ruminococcaceae bacterium]|nr:xanthine phosphoribosyltransferase [Oscillospiraceae bacterium]
MEYLKQKIKECGVVKKGNVLKVDSFLNHQVDVRLYEEIGKEFYRLFGNCEVTKILTIEASGIGIACVAAQFFNCIPVVFAKKSKTSNVSDDVYSSEVASFTHGNVNTVIVSKEYLNKGDRVLIIDDFLANGAALNGLIDIIEQAGAELVGAGIVIEKGFQGGGKLLREKGVRVESLAIIESMNDETGEIVFRN